MTSDARTSDWEASSARVRGGAFGSHFLAFPDRTSNQTDNGLTAPLTACSLLVFFYLFQGFYEKTKPVIRPQYKAPCFLDAPDGTRRLSLIVLCGPGLSFAVVKVL